jgi:hypothetical protein
MTLPLYALNKTILQNRISFWVLGFWMVSHCGWSQIEMSNFTATGRAGISSTLATDYQAQGINPANLAIEPTYDGMHQTFGLGEMGFSVFSDALSKFNLGSALFDPERRLTLKEKYQAAENFADKGLSVNFDFLYAGYAWQKPSGGSGLAFTMRERAQWYSKFNTTSADILFKGLNSDYFDDKIMDTLFNSETGEIDSVFIIKAFTKFPKSLAEILNGTRISLSWTREYGFAYGVNVIHSFNWKLDIGVGLKYIQGIGYMDIASDGKKLTAFIAASPWFGIKFFEPDSNKLVKKGGNLGFLPNSAGQGVGFEFGATGVYRDKYRYSASVTDIGSINYETNVYEASDTLLSSITNNGFYNYNFFQNAQQFDGFQKDMIKWKGLQNRKQDLPTKLRLGFAILNERWNAGFETVIPLNNVAGNFAKPVYSIGGEYKIKDWLRVGSGFLFGGNYGNTVLMPFGITFITSGGLWEMGVASRDIITYVKSSNPVLSLSTGLLRFRF